MCGCHSKEGDLGDRRRPVASLTISSVTSTLVTKSPQTDASRAGSEAQERLQEAPGPAWVSP